MPIYEFHCQECGKESEILVRSSRAKGAACPACGSKKLKKKLSLFASTGGATETSCTGNARSCGLCGTGKAHSH
jgi:putative FmdB family regulatory protein